MDGIYIVRTSVKEEALSETQVVERYKDLTKVEQAFRCFKSVDLKVRPIYHRLENRVRAHVLLCMLAYYVEWHLREALSPLLFEDDAPIEPRMDPVSPKQPSESARKKAETKKTAHGAAVHSFSTLLADLATIVRNTIVSATPGNPTWTQDTEPTPLQRQALALIAKIQPALIELPPGQAIVLRFYKPKNVNGGPKNRVVPSFATACVSTR